MTKHLLSLNRVQKSHDGKPLITDASLGVDVGDRIGLIGANGAGKSTLLRMIASLVAADGGEITIARDARVAYLEQLPSLAGPGDEATTVGQALELAFGELRACIAAYESAAGAMRDEASQLLARIEALGGWDYRYRLEEMAQRVGIRDLDQPIGQLSGGERKRVAIAKVMLQQPDLLLLDEPTNHLDGETVAWLEEWLAQLTNTVILVTHDRYFLDRVVNEMVELREGALHSYSGNYTDYLVARALEEANRARSHHRLLRHLMGELEWARKSPQARTTKSRARLDRIEQTRGEVTRLAGSSSFTADFEFGAAPRLGKTILELEEVGVGYAGQPPLIANLTLRLCSGERIGILGPNGAGKSTLLRLITGELQPTSGRVVVGKNTRVAYFDQYRAAIAPELTVRGTLAPEGGDRVFPAGREPMHVAAWLERFGFATAMHNRPVGTLSGGERNRLAIARFLLSEANLLVLDEPTNDLDITTLNLLEEAIVRFSGCVLIVSHDRYMLDKVATSILAFEGHLAAPGTVSLVPGGYTRYLEQRLEPLRAAHASSTVATSEAPSSVSSASASSKGRTTPRLTYGEQLELRELEPLVHSLEAEVAELEAALAAPDLWRTDEPRGRVLQAQLEAARVRADEAFSRWAELTERAEAGP